MGWKVIFLTEGMVQKEQGLIITKVSYGRACINTPIFFFLLFTCLCRSLLKLCGLH